MMRSRHHLVAAALIALMAVWLVLIARDGDRHPYADETEWITSGYRTLGLVRDLASPGDWDQAYVDLGAWGNQNPPVGKLIIGVAVAAVRANGDSVRYLTTFPFNYQRNLLAGNFPPTAYLVAARTAMALCGAACLVLIYIAAVLLLRVRWAPLAAPILLFASDTFVMHATRVFTDVPQLLLILAAVVAMLVFIGSQRTWVLVLALVLAGLACATKFSAAPIVAAAMLFVAISHGSWRRRALQLVAVAVIPFGVFVAVNPYLYPAPIERTRTVMRQWSAYVARQQEESQLRWSAIHSRVDAISKVTSRAIVAPKLDTWVPFACSGLGAAALLLLRRRRIERWRRNVLALVAAATILDGAAALLPVLVAIGVFWLIRRVRDRDGPSIYAAIVVAMFVVFTVGWIPFDWPRYYLPAIVWMPLLHAAGLAALAARDQKATDVARAG